MMPYGMPPNAMQQRVLPGVGSVPPMPMNDPRLGAGFGQGQSPVQGPYPFQPNPAFPPAPAPRPIMGQAGMNVPQGMPPVANGAPIMNQANVGMPQDPRMQNVMAQRVMPQAGIRIGQAV